MMPPSGMPSHLPDASRKVSRISWSHWSLFEKPVTGAPCSSSQCHASQCSVGDLELHPPQAPSPTSRDRCLQPLSGSPLPSVLACALHAIPFFLGPLFATGVPALGLFTAQGLPVAWWYAGLYAALSLLTLAAAFFLSVLHVQRLLHRLAVELCAVVQNQREDAGVPALLSRDSRLRYLQSRLINSLQDKPATIIDPLHFVEQDILEMGPSPDGFIIINTTGIILSVNDSLCQYFGYAADTLLHENIRLLMPAPYSVQHDHFVRKHIHTGQRSILGRSREVPVLDSAGRQSIVMLRVDDRIDPRDAENRLFLGRMEFRREDPLFSDLRQHLTAGSHSCSNAEAFGMFASCRESIVVADAQGIVVYVNSATCALFGWQAAEILGQNVKVLMAEPFASAHDGFIQSYLRRAAENEAAGQEWPPSTLVGSGRDVMAATKSGQRVRVFLMLSRIDGPTRSAAGAFFVAKMVHIAQADAASCVLGPAARTATLRSHSWLGDGSTASENRPGVTKWARLGPLKVRKCTVVVLEAEWVDVDATHADGLRSNYEQFLSTVFQVCARHKGVLQWVVGPRLICTFNGAAVPNSSHCAAAAAFLVELTRVFIASSLADALRLQVGAATGDVWWGSWGAQPVLQGPLVDLAGLMLRVRAESSAPNPVVDGALFRDLQYTYHLRPINRATVWPTGSNEAVVEAYELLGVREDTEGEWMYQLQHDSPCASWIRAWDHLPPPATRSSPGGTAYGGQTSRRSAACEALYAHLESHEDDACARWLLQALTTMDDGPVQWCGAIPYVLQFRAPAYPGLRRPGGGGGVSTLSLRSCCSGGPASPGHSACRPMTEASSSAVPAC